MYGGKGIARAVHEISRRFVGFTPVLLISIVFPSSHCVTTCITNRGPLSSYVRCAHGRPQGTGDSRADDWLGREDRFSVMDWAQRGTLRIYEVRWAIHDV